MAVKTMAKNTGGGQYTAGWHELTISKAVDGEWNDKRTIDLNFKDYKQDYIRKNSEGLNVKNL